jgi:hypothetical protein
MKNVAAKNNLVYQKDVKKQTVGTTQNIFKFIEINRNITQYSVVWCTTSWTVPDTNYSIPC